MQRNKFHLRDFDLEIDKLYNAMIGASEDLLLEECKDSESPDEELDPYTIMHFESSFIPHLISEFSSGNIALETLTDRPMMEIYVLLNDKYEEYLPAIEQTKISVEPDKDNRTVILYTFPELDAITAAKYGAIVLTPGKNPEYYTLELSVNGKMALCNITVGLHTLIRFLPGQTGAEEFVSLVMQTNAQGFASQVKKREEQIEQLLRTTSCRTGD